MPPPVSGHLKINLDPIMSYNAIAVKYYNATNSLARFENKNIFF
jgi:hypothetical protein